MKPAPQLPKPKGQRGGKRPGAGRPPGTGSTIARRYETVQQALESEDMNGLTPILVMLGNMKYYHDRAESFTEKLEEIAATVSGVDLAEPGNEKVLETLKLVAKVGDFRMKSQQCAMEAAPYAHPKLAALAIKVGSGDSKKPPLEITRSMPAAVAAEMYAELLAQDD